MQKTLVQQALDSFSDEIDVDEFIEKLYLLRKIEFGEQQIVAGKVVTHEDAKQRFEKWLT